MIKNNSFKLREITENIFTTSEMIISNRVGREFLIKKKKKQSVQLLVRQLGKKSLVFRSYTVQHNYYTPLEVKLPVIMCNFTTQKTIVRTASAAAVDFYCCRGDGGGGECTFVFIVYTISNGERKINGTKI